MEVHFFCSPREVEYFRFVMFNNETKVFKKRGNNTITTLKDTV